MGLSYLGSAVAWEELFFHENGSASVNHKYLSRIIFSEADEAVQNYTGVTEMWFAVSDACLNIIHVLKSYLAWASLPLAFLLVLFASTLTR
jgi:hypothetical protein